MARISSKDVDLPTHIPDLGETGTLTACFDCPSRVTIKEFRILAQDSCAQTRKSSDTCTTNLVELSLYRSFPTFMLL